MIGTTDKAIHGVGDHYSGNNAYLFQVIHIFHGLATTEKETIEKKMRFVIAVISHSYGGGV